MNNGEDNKGNEGEIKKDKDTEKIKINSEENRYDNNGNEIIGFSGKEENLILREKRLIEKEKILEEREKRLIAREQKLKEGKEELKYEKILFKNEVRKFREKMKIKKTCSYYPKEPKMSKAKEDQKKIGEKSDMNNKKNLQKIPKL